MKGLSSHVSETAHEPGMFRRELLRYIYIYVPSMPATWKAAKGEVVTIWLWLGYGRLMLIADASRLDECGVVRLYPIPGDVFEA